MIAKDITYHDLMVEKLEQLSNEEFLDFGSDGISYIKPLREENGLELYALHSANGSHIATGQDLQLLKTIAGQHDLAAMPLQ